MWYGIGSRLYAKYFAVHWFDVSKALSASQNLLNPVAQHLQRALLGLRDHPENWNQRPCSCWHDRVLWHPNQRPHHYPTHCDRSFRACLHSSWLEDLPRLWLESLQVPWSRPTDQGDVCLVSDLPLSNQVRRIFLGRLLHSVHLAHPQQPQCGILSYLRGTSIITGAFNRGSLGSKTWEQMDDVHFHDRLCCSNGVLRIQGRVIVCRAASHRVAYIPCCSFKKCSDSRKPLHLCSCGRL